MTDLIGPPTGVGSGERPALAAPSPPGVDALRHAAAEVAGAKLALLDDGSGDPVIGWLNGAAAALLGTEPDELVGQPLSVLQYDDDFGIEHIESDRADWVQLVAKEISQPAQSESATWRSAMLGVPFGAAVPVQVRISPVAGAGWVISLRVVSDPEQRSLEAQRELEHRFAALAEHAPVGIILSEAGARLSYANARFADITGRRIDDLLGNRWLECVHTADLANVLESIDEVLEGYPVEVVTRLTATTDVQRWVQLRLSPVTTPRRAAGFIGTVEDITARRAWEDQLDYQAGHDSLTGLINRRRLTETINQLLTSRRRRDREAAVLFCDLDGFKEINDRHGHDAGDRVLVEVGQRLSAAARAQDLVARIAGDEFVVLVRQVSELVEAEAAAVRHLAALADPIRVAGCSVNVSASIGLAMAGEFDTAGALLRAADLAMYDAKRAGGGLYRVIHP